MPIGSGSDTERRWSILGDGARSPLEGHTGAETAFGWGSSRKTMGLEVGRRIPNEPVAGPGLARRPAGHVGLDGQGLEDRAGRRRYAQHSREQHAGLKIT